MHELSIALSILEVAQEEATNRGAARVMAVHVRLGPLSGVVVQALCSAFELAREGTPLAETQLVVEEVPLTLHCPACGQARPAQSQWSLCCIDCGTPTGQIVSGNELEVTALELEV